MASRLQQFATRNQRESFEPQGSRYAASRRGANRSQRARREPTLLDTDVESIGNATTLSFADYDEDPEREDTESELRSDDVFIEKNDRKHRWPSSPRSGARAPVRSGWQERNTGMKTHDQLYEREPPILGQLDEVSILPDSSRDQPSEPDRSPSSQKHDPDVTPRRTQTRTYEQDLESPLGAFKQHLKRSSSPVPPPSQPQPLARTLPLSQSSGNHSFSDTSLLDYTPTTLDQMTYSQLAAEPFERDPKRTDADTFPDVEGLNAATIAERLRNVMFREGEPSKDGGNDDDGDDAAKHARLAALFSQLSLEQYEMAGDVILAQFGAVFGRFQEIRRRKRAVAHEFEQRVAEREALVQQRHDGLDRSAAYLKKQGEDFMRGGPSGE